MVVVVGQHDQDRDGGGSQLGTGGVGDGDGSRAGQLAVTGWGSATVRPLQAACTACRLHIFNMRPVNGRMLKGQVLETRGIKWTVHAAHLIHFFLKSGKFHFV